MVASQPLRDESLNSFPQVCNTVLDASEDATVKCETIQVTEFDEVCTEEEIEECATPPTPTETPPIPTPPPVEEQQEMEGYGHQVVMH